MKHGLGKQSLDLPQVLLYDEETFYRLFRDVVASVGPVSIVMCVVESFYNYNSGVYNDPTCCTGSSHAVLLVGLLTICY